MDGDLYKLGKRFPLKRLLVLHVFCSVEQDYIVG